MVGSSNNYFQSNSFSDNPLRKNSDLNKERMRLLSDPTFLKENPKLSHFLFTKYLKGVSSIPIPDESKDFEVNNYKIEILFCYKV